MINPGEIHVVVGGQFGSEAKGHIAAQLHRSRKIHHAVRVGGPNAGHSAVDANGQVWALRTIPVAAVVDPDCQLVIARGSEVDPEVLYDELDRLEAAGHRVAHRLVVDAQATILEKRHVEQEGGEKLQERLGSTAKGIGAARSDRIMRTALLADQIIDMDLIHPHTAAMLQYAHRDGENILIEGTQGYGLGLHAGHYPHCTSNNCAAVDFISQAGIQPLNLTHNWVVYRTYPIRVAGNSGGMYLETDWDTLAAKSGGYIQAERTTVTKKIRRVGEWDSMLAIMALDANGGRDYPNIHPVLTFVDYLDPDLAGCTDIEMLRHSPAAPQIINLESDLGMSFEAFTTSNNTIIWGVI